MGYDLDRHFPRVFCRSNGKGGGVIKTVYLGSEVPGLKSWLSGVSSPLSRNKENKKIWSSNLTVNTEFILNIKYI